MTQLRFCSRCGSELDAHGLCPACMLAAASASRPAPKREPAPAPAEIAAHFPRLEIVRLIGEGGMGLVYEAVQKGLERKVALKLLSPRLVAEPGFSERFTREARVLAALSHPNIVAVHEFGVSGPWCYLAMEHVDGASLRQLVRARDLTPRQALSIVCQMCDALQFAHDHGVVHRDIKPENVLVDRSGKVKVLDFGLSKILGGELDDTLTRTDQVMGTPHYMAPEQWEKPLTVDHRADIYSLGVVFYELLTGELPLGRFAPPSRKVVIDVRLDEVVLRALEKEPALRYQHASDVRTDVERCDEPGRGPVAAAVASAPDVREQPTRATELLRAVHARRAHAPEMASSEQPRISVPAPRHERGMRWLIVILVLAALVMLAGMSFLFLMFLPS